MSHNSQFNDLTMDLPNAPLIYFDKKLLQKKQWSGSSKSGMGVIQTCRMYSIGHCSMTHVPIGFAVIAAIIMVQKVDGFQIKILLAYCKWCNIILLMLSLISRTSLSMLLHWQAILNIVLDDLKTWRVNVKPSKEYYDV